MSRLIVGFLIFANVAIVGLVVAVIMLFITKQTTNGAKGPQGPEGKKGDTGPLGRTGANGINGINGINGTNSNATVFSYMTSVGNPNNTVGGTNKLLYSLGGATIGSNRIYPAVGDKFRIEYMATLVNLNPVVVGDANADSIDFFLYFQNPTGGTPLGISVYNVLTNNRKFISNDIYINISAITAGGLITFETSTFNNGSQQQVTHSFPGCSPPLTFDLMVTYFTTATTLLERGFYTITSLQT
jgi:hypothetical protein